MIVLVWGLPGVRWCVFERVKEWVVKGRRLPGSGRGWVQLTAVAAALSLVLAGAALAAFPRSGAVRPGVVAAGSRGSVHHYSWWDPRGWFGGGSSSSVPRARTISAAGGPQTGRKLRQVSVPAPHRVGEVVSKRSADSRVYRLSDGRMQAVISAGPVNYRGAGGRWEPIDTAVHRVSKPGYVFGNTTNTYRSFFGPSAGRLARFEAPGAGTLSIALDGARGVSPQVKGSTVSYSNIAADTSLRYQVTPGALKEDITLASPSAPASFTYSVKVAGGLVPWQRPGGQIMLSRAGVGGPAALVIPAPFMTSAAGDRWSPYGKVWSPRVSQRMAWDPATHTLRLTLTPDAAWLHRAGRVFPVTIDPTVEVAPTPTDAQNTMVESDTPSTNYSSDWRLSVGTTSTADVRALLSFPLDAVPAGTRIDSADLRLYYDQNFGGGSADETIQADEATGAWDAATATWANTSGLDGQEGLNQVIVDDSDTTSTTAAGSWQMAAAAAANGGGYQYNQDTAAGDTFTWVPRLTEAGDYFVADHYPPTANAATNAPVTVNFDGGSADYTVDQQAGSGGQWAVLGKQPFTAGTAGSVVLGDGPASASTRVIADAARFRLWGEQVVHPDVANVWDSFPVRNIVQDWVNTPANNHGFVVKSATEATMGLGGPRYEASRFAYQGEVATYPQLVVTYGRPAVTLNQITDIHATGADLSWSPYVNTTGDPGADLAEYQVYRSVFQSFTPSPSTLVSPVAAGTTSYSDTSAKPTPADSPDQFGNAFYYMVAVKTKDGQIIAGPTQLVRLPKAGYNEKILDATASATLSEGLPNTNEQHISGQPWLAAGDDSSTFGVTRTVVHYQSMADAGIPAGATVTDAELKLWGWFNDTAAGASYDVHALTQSFVAGTTTWNMATGTTAWTNPGGTFKASTGSISGLTNDPNRQEWPVTSTVQGWVDTPSSEHGLLVKETSEGATAPQEQELFLDTSAAEPALRPELVVTYLDTTPEDTYYSPQLPDPMSSAASYTVPVTLTNTTASTWAAADWVVAYHWLQPDGTDISDASDEVQTPLTGDIAPGGVATINAAVTTPDTSGSGGDRTGYQLAWDLFNKTTGTWLSSGTATPAAGAGAGTAASGSGVFGVGTPGLAQAPAAAGNNTVAALKQAASVEQPSSDQLGLEKFYQYTGVNTGAGSSLLTNAAAGNTVWSYNAFSNPSRGFATFVRLAYNSMDTSDSAMGFGWSLQASTLMRLGSPLDFLPNPNPTTVKLTDGDGTSHLFTWDAATSQWLSPPGLHDYLQQVGTCDASGKTENSRAWLLTAPDRTQFYFDCQGYQTAVVDNNGNEADFTYSERNSNNKPVKFLDYITDPSGRQTLTVDYYHKGDDYQFIDDTGALASGTNLTDPDIIDHIKSLTDISGRTITFLYTTQGLMARMTDGDGTGIAKVFQFAYDMTQGNKNVKLVQVTDPRGDATNVAYYTAPVDPKFKWSTQTITDRRAGTTGFAYTEPAPGQAAGTMQTQVTDPNSHTSTYQLDTTGRPVQVTNAKAQVAKIGYDSDNNVTSLTEDNGANTTWTYDPNTGYPLTMHDAQANHDGTAGYTYTYQTGLGGHIADLISKLTPQQRLWTFGYDPNGNLTTVTDPDGNTPSAAAGSYTTSYTYDPLGQLAAAKDADGNTTTYADYGADGYPQTITDAAGNATSYVYDTRGNVTAVTDPLGHTSSYTYDTFGRPGQSVVPKDQAAGVFITTPAPVYDGNDNVTQSTAPNGAVTTYSYDPNDELTSQTAPPNSATGTGRQTTYSYDPAGNLATTTSPNGNATGAAAGSFTTTYAYDEINELTSVTDAAGDVTKYGYDDTGNRTSVIDPRGNQTDTAFNLNHWQTSVTDAGGFTSSTGYDLDGLVTSTTDQNGHTTQYTLDPRGDLIQQIVPPDVSSSGATTTHVTQYVYDQAGNRTQVLSPRAVAAGFSTTSPCVQTQTCPFTDVTHYDADNRQSAQLTAFDPSDPVYNKPAETDYVYDAASRLASVTAPPSAGQTTPNVTSYHYFDNGWVQSSTDPTNIVTSYDYNDLGEQHTRTITSADQAMSRTMTWDYNPDGSLQKLTDAGVPTGLYSEMADNSDTQNTAASPAGAWATASSAAGHVAHDYATDTNGTATDSFTWKLHIPADGTYTVYVAYPAVTGATSSASYTVTHSDGAGGTATSTATADQTTSTSPDSNGKTVWVALGSWAFTQSGTGQQVSVAGQAGATVVADAVRVVRDHSADPNTATKAYTYTYDPDGNQTGITVDATPAPAVASYGMTYNGIDQLTKVEEDNNTGAAVHTTTYSYDPAGNLASRGHDAAMSTYTYGVRNLLIKETDTSSASDPSPQVTTFGYTPTGQQINEVKPNSNKVSYTYYPDDMVASQVEKTQPAGTIVDSHSYSYDPDGNKTQDIAQVMNADNTTASLSHTYGYSYDPRDEITQVTTDGTPTETYTHDPNSNVASQTINSTQTTFSYTGNQVTSATTGGTTDSYNYDPLGRLDTITAGSTTIQQNTYDGFDNLTQQKQGTNTTSYTYDPLNRMASQTVNSGTPTQYSYLGLSSDLITESSGGTTTKSYTYTASDQRLSQTTDTGTNQGTGYYTYNSHNDVEAVTGADGNTTSTYGYTAYGQPIASQFTGADKNTANPSPTAQPYSAYRFNAMRWNSSTGQYDMGFRNYDPGLNQFLSRDMYDGALADMGLSTDPFTGNRYTFGGGNPITNIELDGHMFPGTGGGRGDTLSQPQTKKDTQNAATGKPVCISQDFCFNPKNTNINALRKAYNSTDIPWYRILAWVNASKQLNAYAHEVQIWQSVCSSTSYCSKGTTAAVNKIYGTLVAGMNNVSSGWKCALLQYCNYSGVAKSIANVVAAIGQVGQNFPPIKPGSSGGPTAGKRFSNSVKNQALEENRAFSSEGLNTCVYCRLPTDTPQIDHAIPRSLGGNATLENAQVTCPWCNGSKNNAYYPRNPPEDFEGDWPPWEIEP